MMATFRRFEEIDAWKSALELASLIYDLSEKGGLSRDFGFRDQMRRSGISVMSNIAEGCDSESHRVFARYASIAKASAGEL